MRGFMNFRFGKNLCADSAAVPAELTPTELAGPDKGVLSGRLAKLLVVALVFGFIAASPLFAAETIDKLDNFGDKIISLLDAKWLKAILALGLVIEFGVIAFGNSQGEGGMVKKVLPWIIGTGGILAATSIVSFVFKGVTAGSTAGW